MIFFLLSALSTTPAEQQAVIYAAETFAQSVTQPINIGCATDPIAVQVGVVGWSPLCSHGTLTDASNALVYNGSFDMELMVNGQVPIWIIIQNERERLSDPKMVTAVYQQLRPVVIPIVKTGTTENLDSVRSYLTDVIIPDFTLEVPASLRELYRVEAEADAAMLKARVYKEGVGTIWDPVTVLAYTTANLAFGQAAISAGFHDPLALQWRLRREKEGGKALVRAWRDVFIDLAQSI